MRADGLAAVAANAFYHAMVPIMRLALASNFRRVRVLHGERMPRDRAVLLVANHPSTWTDVALLDVAFGRRFHFLARDEQFRPWPRGALLRLYGTLPLSSREHRADAMARNAATFLRCETLFDRDEGVAVFPEGVSRVDRGLLPLKHGAARLALSYAGYRGDRRPLALVPVGIHYSDRTAFQSEVTVDVGEAIVAAEWRARDGDPEEAARRLTDRMTAAMRGLVLEGGDGRHAWLFSALEPLAAGSAGSLELESARRLARALMDSRRDRPSEFARLERRARTFERMRRALGASHSTLEDRSRAEGAGAVLALLAGAVPALAGLAIHALPAALTHAATRRYASDPSRIAFARIASGFLFFPLTYGMGTTLLLAGTRVRPVWVFLVILPLSGLLGLFAQGYTRRVRLEYERCRVARISRRHGRFVRRARRERDILRAQVETFLS